MEFQDLGDVRGRVHHVLERREDREQLGRNNLKIAVSQVVHEIEIGNVTKQRNDRACFCQYPGRNWYTIHHQVH